MNANINQIRKDYNNSISKIPEKKLKELYSSLYYEAYYTFFIEPDDEAHKKAINALERLTNENEPWKRFNAAKDAMIRVPIKILIELHNKNIAERKEIIADLLSGYLILLKSDNNLLISLIEYIDQSIDEKSALEFVREQMVKMKDETSKLLNHDLLLKLIEYYEAKGDLSDDEIEVIDLLKEIKAENE